MKKALLIGPNSYLGRHLSRHLVKRGYRLAYAGMESNSFNEHESYVQIDITDLHTIKSLDFNVDIILNFAGLTGTSIGFQQFRKFIEVNEIGLLNVLSEMVMQSSSARLIFPSTRLVYNGQKGIFLRECDEKNAKTIYAQNKLACENYLELYQQNFGIDYTVFRICIPYGNLFDETYSYGTIGFMLRKAKNGENIVLFGDGALRRTFTHVEDICESIVRGMMSTETLNGVFNISGENFSLDEVAQQIANKFGVLVEYIDWQNEQLKIESGDTIFDATRLTKIIQYDNCYKFSDWLGSF